MVFSWWSHQLDYIATVPGKQDFVSSVLSQHYKTVPQLMGEQTVFKIKRGSLLMSIFAFGSEIRCLHFIRITITQIEPNAATVQWSIDLKVSGLIVGKNALIEECKTLESRLKDEKLPHFY